eukprot:scaffold78622_cov20-Tisochrysis_lutea.AAC.1
MLPSVAAKAGECFAGQKKREGTTHASAIIGSPFNVETNALGQQSSHNVEPNATLSQILSQC